MQTIRMKHAPEFEKVRFAIRRLAAEEQKAASKPQPKEPQMRCALLIRVPTPRPWVSRRTSDLLRPAG